MHIYNGYLGPGFTGFSLKAMIDDAGVEMKNFSAWERVALVSDHQLINGFTNFLVTFYLMS